MTNGFKVMPRSYKGHKFILCIIDDVTNYLIIVLIHQSRLEGIGDTLIENVISKYCVPDYISVDQSRTFRSSLMNYLFKKLDTKIKIVSPYNHQSLQAEHKIIIYNLDQAFNKSRSDVAKIFASSNSGI